jgi:hypothetical protein
MLKEHSPALSSKRGVEHRPDSLPALITAFEQAGAARAEKSYARMGFLRDIFAAVLPQPQHAKHRTPHTPHLSVRRLDVDCNNRHGSEIRERLQAKPIMCVTPRSDVCMQVADVSGHMNKEQLREALQRAGLNPTVTQLEKTWDLMDSNRCGKVTLRDFARGCGHVLIAHAFSLEAAAQRAAEVELADLKEVYGGELPRWWKEMQGEPEPDKSSTPLATLDALQRRFCFVQTRLADAGLLVRLFAEKCACLEETNQVLQHEVEALRPLREQVLDLKAELEAATRRAQEANESEQDIRNEYMAARRLIEKQLGSSALQQLPHLKSAFSEQQEKLLQELQAQVRELSVPDERYCRLEERVEQMTKGKAEMESKMEANESLLHSVVQLNQYLAAGNHRYSVAHQQAQTKLAKLHNDHDALQWEMAAAKSRMQELEGQLRAAAGVVRDLCALHPALARVVPSSLASSSSSFVVAAAAASPQAHGSEQEHASGGDGMEAGGARREDGSLAQEAQAEGGDGAKGNSAGVTEGEGREPRDDGECLVCGGEGNAREDGQDAGGGASPGQAGSAVVFTPLPITPGESPGFKHGMEWGQVWYIGSCGSVSSMEGRERLLKAGTKGGLGEDGSLDLSWMVASAGRQATGRGGKRAADGDDGGAQTEAAAQGTPRQSVCVEQRGSEGKQWHEVQQREQGRARTLSHAELGKMQDSLACFFADLVRAGLLVEEAGEASSGCHCAEAAGAGRAGREGAVELALRIAERNCDTLVQANQGLSQHLLHALLGAAMERREAGEAASLRAANQRVRGHGAQEMYKSGQEQADLYNEMMAPKVGPGSKQERKPLWLFKDKGHTDMDTAREMVGGRARSTPFGGYARPVFGGQGRSPNEAIAKWLQQFRLRLKHSSVRFLASQDSTVLGAQLYTQSAFDKLLRRANAITDDMLREAATLRSEDNAGDELAHELSLLLEETVNTTHKMNSLAQVVHEIMLRRINKLQTENAAASASLGGSSADEGLGVAWLKNTLGAVTPEQPTAHRALGNGLAHIGLQGEVDDELKPGLLSLASLSGVFGEVSVGDSSAEAQQMQQLLKDIEKVVAEQRAGVDHRANGYTTKNAGSQMKRAQAAVKHNTLFGMMTSRLETAAASFNSDNSPA